MVNVIPKEDVAALIFSIKAVAAGAIATPAGTANFQEASAHAIRLLAINGSHSVDDNGSGMGTGTAVTSLGTGFASI